ncbi:hypothetical protein TELCIR_05375 [Teladorsagia circumcincta]|uniref:Uncharacterized protein n=1 Tax=Teladorsagia circumcincta TaxID=45464 RepID=A0A2G9UR03_TELCI|nr:hypothetical protein TELCIR_05375 [Teladorsagia circumcincta]
MLVSGLYDICYIIGLLLHLPFFLYRRFQHAVS